MKHIVETCKKRKVAVGHPHVDSTNVERILGEGYTFLMAAPTRELRGARQGPHAGEADVSEMTS